MSFIGAGLVTILIGCLLASYEERAYGSGRRLQS